MPRANEASHINVMTCYEPTHRSSKLEQTEVPAGVCQGGSPLKPGVSRLKLKLNIPRKRFKADMVGIKDIARPRPKMDDGGGVTCGVTCVCGFWLLRNTAVGVGWGMRTLFVTCTRCGCYLTQGWVRLKAVGSRAKDVS